MSKASIDKRIRAVLLYIDGVREAKEICAVYDIPVRTFRRWVSTYRNGGIDNLKPKRRGPANGTNSIPGDLEQRMIELKQKHPSWGARRLKYQYDLPCHWGTVHRIIKRHQMLVRIKPKPQPPVKRFQRKHVDSMWHLCNARAPSALASFLLLRSFHDPPYSSFGRGSSTPWQAFSACTFKRLSAFRHLAEAASTLRAKSSEAQPHQVVQRAARSQYPGL